MNLVKACCRTCRCTAIALKSPQCCFQASFLSSSAYRRYEQVANPSARVCQTGHVGQEFIVLRTIKFINSVIMAHSVIMVSQIPSMVNAYYLLSCSSGGLTGVQLSQLFVPKYVPHAIAL